MDAMQFGATNKSERLQYGSQAESWVEQFLIHRGCPYLSFTDEYFKLDFCFGRGVWLEVKRSNYISSHCWNLMRNIYTKSIIVFVNHNCSAAEWCWSKDVALCPDVQRTQPMYGMMWIPGIEAGRTPFAKIDKANSRLREWTVETLEYLEWH